MHKTLLAAWPLFFGISMIMIGNGLQNTLLGVRGTMENFPTYVIGMIMSMYFVGFMLGSHYVPKLIRGVGHIRVFSALASIASTTVLFHGLFPNEFAWGVIRAVTGFSYAGLYIVIESWLNQAATNKTRGKMMATYLVILYTSMAVGQYLLTLADPKDMDLFVVASILITMAVLPISLSSRPAPQFSAPAKVSIKEMFRASPLGIYGVFASGVAASTLFSIGPVYAAQAGFSRPEIATFMALVIAGGVLMQFPIGWASDKFDRRKVLIFAAAMTAFSCGFAYSMHMLENHYGIFLAMFMIGGTALTIYGLASAHTNDHLTKEQTVAASASMIFINGTGSIIGPLLSSALMNIIAPYMIFVMMGCVYTSIAAFGIYRTTRRASVPLDQQTDFVAQPSPSTLMILQQTAEESQESLKPLNKKQNQW